MTVALDETADTAEDDDWQDVGRPAGWWTRAGAFAIDVLCPLAVAVTLLLTGWSAPRGGWLWWLCLLLAAALVLAIAANRVLLPVVTGWTFGRSVVGIEVLDGDGDTPSAARLLAREAAHVLDTLPFALGWLWPLLDSRGRTFADILTGTVVRHDDGELPDRHRLATRALAAAGAASVLVALLGFATVYRHEQALAKTRAQISDSGPKMVSEMLSYTTKNAKDDFAHAQTLVTDDYRPELIKQQDAVQKSGLADNDYWVSNSSVIAASADHATMLLLLQGQRGTAPKQRFVTASIRAEFARIGDGWKVANLTVLAAPKPPPAPAEPGKPEPPKSPSQSAKPEPPKADAPKPTDAPKPPPASPAPKPTGGGR